MATGYSHTQRAPLALVLYGFALFNFSMLGVLVVTGQFDPIGITCLAGVGLLLAGLAPGFHTLTVADEGDMLAIRFGPAPYFRRTVRYADLVSVEVGRTHWLDGWGIHLSIRGGSVWNLWGRDCVVLHLRNDVLRIGTDDAENLARFLEHRTPQEEK